MNYPRSYIKPKFEDLVQPDKTLEGKGWLGGVGSSGSEEVESGLTKIEADAILNTGFIPSSHSAK
jgi:hypothetical protein